MNNIEQTKKYKMKKTEKKHKRKPKDMLEGGNYVDFYKCFNISDH